MRRVLFRLMIIIVLFLVIVLGVAAREKTSPKAVLQDWFSNKDTILTTGQIIDNLPTDLTGSQTGNLDGSTTGSNSLSDQDRQDTENFINSLVQQP